MKDPSVQEIIRLVWPVILIQLALAISAVVDIIRKKKTRNLSPVGWILIALLANFIGPILYFIAGRAED
ncbi:MAG: PLDc_N domain-containing protein [Rubrobacteridae bacterium]|nr:PLDc_N domain-containing protein [Rubrobacteridae bacterium]